MAASIVTARGTEPVPEVDLARAVPLLCAELDRTRARVAELEARPSRAEAYRHLADELRLLQGVEPDGVKVAGLYAAELRVRRMADAAEAAEPAPTAGREANRG